MVSLRHGEADMRSIFVNERYVTVFQGSSGENRDLNEERSDFELGPTQETPPDGAWQAELVRRSLAGDETAFSLIMDQYGKLLLRTAYVLIGDEEMAKDIVQDSFILAWKNLGKLREPAFLRAWLLKIAVNQSISLKRQLARKAALLRQQLLQQDIDKSIREADFQRGFIEDNLDMGRAIGQLPMNQRVVLTMFYYHRMTMPEIAEVLGVAENTLRKRLQSALDKLRRVLLAEIPAGQAAALSAEMNPRIGIRRGGVQ